MNIESETFDDGVRKISLSGRLDIQGAQEIDLKFSGLTANQRSVVVDLAGVSFLASIGIRTLLLAAKAVSQRGGKLVLCNPDAGIVQILKTAGIDSLIPIFPSLDQARLAVAAA